MQGKKRIVKNTVVDIKWDHKKLIQKKAEKRQKKGVLNSCYKQKTKNYVIDLNPIILINVSGLKHWLKVKSVRLYKTAGDTTI